MVRIGLRALLGLYPGYGLDAAEEPRRGTYAVASTLAITIVFAVAARRGPALAPAGVRRVRGLALLAPLVRQLWNVLRGEMTLVGPRPIVEAEILRYDAMYDLYRRVTPGISGIWQVSGRNDTSYEERVTLDAYYVRNWSVWLDLVILARTLTAVAGRRGAR